MEELLRTNSILFKFFFLEERTKRWDCPARISYPNSFGYSQSIWGSRRVKVFIFNGPIDLPDDVLAVYLDDFGDVEEGELSMQLKQGSKWRLFVYHVFLIWGIS